MINKSSILRRIKRVIKDGVMDTDWSFDDCRLENNGLIRKGCGYNQSFRYKAELNKDINMKLIEWCDKNCEGKYGWYFKIKQPSTNWPTRECAVFTFQKKFDCVNFKLKQL